MVAPIVSSIDPITVLGGAETDPEDLKEALILAPQLVAADSGGDRALQAGLRPSAVIGDMDSLSAAGRAALAPVLHEVSEQDSTDFDKALRHIAAPLVLAVGFAGGRFDHELAVMNVLVRRADQPCIVIGAQNIVFLCPPMLSLDLPRGTVCSLFPLAPVTARSAGLRWPTDGLLLEPDGRIGTSNEVTGPLTLAVDAPKLLVILPRVYLADAAKALLAQAKQTHARWPAP